MSSSGNSNSISTASLKGKQSAFSKYDNGQSLLHNRYKKLTSLQSGTFGKVSLALDTVTNQKVAIKAMDRSVLQVDQVAQHEIAILAKLKDNDNICQLLDHFRTKTHYFLVLEYCEFGDLHDFLNDNSDNTNTLSKPYDNSYVFKNFAADLASAIQHCHDNGIYHRDIKPENILVTKDLKFKLADWGLATTSRFSNEAEIGTDKYMAPECIFNDDGDDGNSTYYDCMYADYWSLGITLLYTLFGKSPFKKCTSEADPLFKRYINGATSGSILAKKDNVDLSIFYDIYPNLSQTGFESLVRPLLQFVPQQRNLSDCLEAMDYNYCYGFTVDEELEIEEFNRNYNNYNNYKPIEVGKTDVEFFNAGAGAANDLLVSTDEALLDEDEARFFEEEEEEKAVGDDSDNDDNEEFNHLAYSSSSPLQISSENLRKLATQSSSVTAVDSSDNSRLPSIPPSLIDSTPATSFMKFSSNSDSKYNSSTLFSVPINISNGSADASTATKNNNLSTNTDAGASAAAHKNSVIYGSNITSDFSWDELDDFDDYEIINSFKKWNISSDAKPQPSQSVTSETTKNGDIAAAKSKNSGADVKTAKVGAATTTTTAPVKMQNLSSSITAQGKNITTNTMVNTPSKLSSIFDSNWC